MSNSAGYERASGKSNGRSWSLILFIFFINIFVLLLIVDIRGSEIFRTVMLGIAMLIAIVKIFTTRFRKDQTGNNNPLDLISLIRKYFRINRKYLLVSIIGLILAIAVISQIILLSSSPVGNIYQDALDNGRIPAFEVQNWDSSGAESFYTVENDLIELFETEMNEEGIEIDRVDLRVSYYIEMAFQFNISETDTIEERMRMGVNGISEETFNFYKQFPSFPSELEWKSNLTLLMLEDGFVNYIENQGDIPEDPNDIQFYNPAGNNFTIQFDGYWELTNEDWDFGYQTLNLDYREMRLLRNGILGGQDFITTFTDENELEIDDQNAYGYLDITSLQGMDPERVILVLENLVSSLYSFFETRGFYNVYIDSPAERNIYWAQDSGSEIRFTLLLVSLPLLSIALYLVYFSLNLVERRKQNLVAIMKIRGISTNQLQTMMFAESLIGAAIATVIGMLISLPWAEQILLSTMVYGEGTALFIPENWYWKIPVIGLILSIDMNIFSIVGISSTTVEQGESQEESSEPFWRRYYIDVIFTVIGLAIWTAIRVLPLNPMWMEIILFFGAWTLPILILGIPLVVARFYSNFLTFISDFLWKREGNFIALATRNMRKNKFSASKLAVLLIIGMMFSFVAIGVPGSFTTYAQEESYYSVGADFGVEGINPENATHMEVFSNQSEIASVTQVRQTYMDARSSSYWGINILAVDPSSYVESAFWESSYADESLKDLMKKLAAGEILVQEDVASTLEWEIGTNTSITSQEDGTRINQKIGGTFKYWPRLVNYLYIYENQVDQVFLVMNMDTFQDYFNQTYVTVLAKAKDSVANHTKVLENLENDFEAASIDIYGINSAQYDYERFVLEGPVALLFDMLDNLLYVTIITSIIGVGYFSFITLSERKKEIGVFRAVGMVSRQIFILLLIESVILVSTSIVIGILAGSFISSNIFLLLQNTFGAPIPPIRLVYPPVKTGIFVISALIFSVIAAAIPARSTASKQTGSILRAE